VTHHPWRSVLPLDERERRTIFRQGQDDFCSRRDARAPLLISCHSGRRLGEKIVHRVPKQVSVVAEIGGIWRLRQDHELAITVRELAEEIEQRSLFLSCLRTSPAKSPRLA
jgi:hypothetical protein